MAGGRATNKRKGTRLRSPAGVIAGDDAPIEDATRQDKKDKNKTKAAPFVPAYGDYQSFELPHPGRSDSRLRA